MKTGKRIFNLNIIILIIVLSACNSQDQQKPNILVIVADDLGYADMSFLEHAPEGVSTPNIDQIADGGTYFSNAYATSPICSPSRAGLITGRYQERWGNYWYGEGGLPASETTIPQKLKKSGYQTYKVGKTHLNGGPVENPLDHGFDSFLGFMDHTWDYLRLSNEDVKEYGKENANRAHIGPLWQGKDRKSYEDGYTTDIFSDKATEIIKNAGDKPFYLQLAYNAVHHPTYVCHPDYLDEIGIEQFPFWDPEKESYREWHSKWGHLGKVDPDGRKRYLLQLKVMDDGIGRILDALEESGKKENTMIIFLSDNGGTINTYADNTPLDGYKYMFGEGGIRIPMLVSDPAIEEQPDRNDALVSAMDIFPTLMEKVVEQSPENLDGKSLMPLINGQSSNEHHDHLVWSNGRDDWVVRKDQWKLVHNIGWSHKTFKIVDGKCVRDTNRYRYPGGIRLYNLEKDIAEQHDVKEAHPEVVDQMTSLYHEWRGEMSEPRRGNGELKPKPEKGEQVETKLQNLAANAYSTGSDKDHYGNRVTDGYSGTYWESLTGNNAAEIPHFLTIRLKESTRISGFKYWPHQQSNTGRLKEYAFFVSKDGKNWGNPVAKGTWDDEKETKTVKFPQPVKGKYLKLKVNSVHGDGNLATVAELDIMQ